MQKCTKEVCDRLGGVQTSFVNEGVYQENELALIQLRIGVVPWS